jgi:hypothetical protein
MGAKQSKSNRRFKVITSNPDPFHFVQAYIIVATVVETGGFAFECPARRQDEVSLDGVERILI